MLPGVRQGVAFLFARNEGFRFHGQMIGKGAKGVEIIVSRFTEPPPRSMSTLPDPISLEESRKLALHVIGPYLDAVLVRGDDSAKMWALNASALADPGGTLERLGSVKFQNELARDRVRSQIARGLVVSDPEEAAAVAESIPSPESRAGAGRPGRHLAIVRASAQASRLLDRALLQARAAKRLVDRVHVMCEVAERWIDVGERRPGSIAAQGMPHPGRADDRCRRPDAGLLRHPARSPICPGRWSMFPRSGAKSRPERHSTTSLATWPRPIRPSASACWE